MYLYQPVMQKLKPEAREMLKVLPMKILTPVLKAATFGNSASSFPHKPKPILHRYKTKWVLPVKCGKEKGSSQ